MMKVGSARKAAGVAYPNLYATDAEAKADRKKLVNSCLFELFYMNWNKMLIVWLSSSIALSVLIRILWRLCHSS